MEEHEVLMDNNGIRSFTVGKMLVYLLLLFVLSFPELMNNRGHYGAMWQSLHANLVLLFLLIIATSLLARAGGVLASGFFFLILVSLFFIKLSYWLLHDFTGKGFSSEVFAHIDPLAFKVALSEYSIYLMPFGLVLMFFAFLVFKRINLIVLQGQKMILLALGFSLLNLLALDVGKTVEAKFANALEAFHFRELRKFSDINQAASILQDLRFGEVGLPAPKRFLKAGVARGKDKKNLILVYLESFNRFLTEHPDYPGLTPNLSNLDAPYVQVSHVVSSAYVTIEGIANTQCGTLMNMEYGNNSLTSDDGRVPALPCLGDFLNSAGYHQVYIGGADLDFAGKGKFLSDHGYDEILGWNHWIEQGYKAKTNVWGLPDDLLFEFALEKIEVLSKLDRPYNLTLLTLGTHIPGYIYDDCPEYTNESEKRFLNAIHCTDYLVGRFLDALEQKGALEDTLVYITGDHGVFPNTQMKELFAEKVDDHRIYTAFNPGDSWFREASLQSQRKDLATVDMLATILDLLHIEHNSKYILSRSLFMDEKPSRFLLTRYDDYYQGERVFHEQKEDCGVDTEAGRLPFSLCHKELLLDALYTVNEQYKPPDFQLAKHCEMGVSAYIYPYNNKLEMWFGDLDISEKFIYLGRSVESGSPGMYLLTLTDTAQPGQLLFYPDSQESLQDLQESLTSLPVNHSAVLVNAGFLQVPHDSEILHSFMSDWVYGYIRKGNEQFEVLQVESDRQKGMAIMPDSCEDPGEVFTVRKHRLPNPFCEIETWGPTEATVGNGFNVQENGDSAFWVKTACVPEKSVLVFSGKLLQTIRYPDLLTASMPSNQVPDAEGEFDVSLFDPQTGHEKLLGKMRFK